MTDTELDVMERDRETSSPRRRGMRLGVLGVVVVAAAGVLAAVLWWPNGGEAPVFGEDPPYGLTEVGMPNTEAEVVAVLEALPAIDGRQPSLGSEGGWASAKYYESASGEVKVGISAIYDPELREAFPEWNVEASVGDPDSDLLWMTPPFADEESFGLMWAASDGSWLFVLDVDTAEQGPYRPSDGPDLRVRLVDAFVTAAGG